MISQKENYYTLIFDGDTSLFRFAKALQEDYIEVWWKDRMMECKNLTYFKGGKINGQVIKGKLEEINENRKDPFLLEEFEIIPKSRLLKCDNDKKRLGLGKKWIREYISELYAIPWVKEIKYCLSSETNFRKEVDPLYKSTRGEKPILLKQLRKEFIKEFKDIIEIHGGLEADDLLSCYGYLSRNTFTNPKDTNIVLCGYDKDLLQIYNNFFYNFDKRDEGVIWIDEFTGQKNLVVQCLCGDTVDAITGLPSVTEEMKEKYNIRMGGVGKGKAESILSNCDTVECLFREVEWCYRSYYGDGYKEALNREFRLVKLREHKDKMVDFPFMGE